MTKLLHNLEIYHFIPFSNFLLARDLSFDLILKYFSTVFVSWLLQLLNSSCFILHQILLHSVCMKHWQNWQKDRITTNTFSANFTNNLKYSYYLTIDHSFLPLKIQTALLTWELLFRLLISLLNPQVSYQLIPNHKDKAGWILSLDMILSRPENHSWKSHLL